MTAALGAVRPARITELALAVERAVGAGEAGEAADRVAAALARFAGDRDLLAPEHCAPRQDCYARHLLHADPAGRFSIWAMVWLPGQASTIHDHSCWCVMGAHRGQVTEIAYRPMDPGDPASPVEPCGEVVCAPGAVRALHPGVANIHRVRNAGAGVAISIHVYGFDPRAAESSVDRTYCSV